MEQRRTAIVTLAFGATVAMWGVGYIGRLPSIMASSPVLAGGLLACLFAAGWLAGGIRSVRLRRRRRGRRARRLPQPADPRLAAVGESARPPAAVRRYLGRRLAGGFSAARDGSATRSGG